MRQPQKEITIPIIEAVSEELDTPFETLPLLSDAIDVDGLEAVVTGSPDQDVTVSFAYAGLRVRVESDRTVNLRPL